MLSLVTSAASRNFLADTVSMPPLLLTEKLIIKIRFQSTGDNSHSIDLKENTKPWCQSCSRTFLVAKVKGQVMLAE